MAAKLKQLSPFVGVKSTLPILEYILLHKAKDDNKMYMTGTNLELTMVTHIEVPEKVEPFHVCVNYTELFKLISALNYDEYEVTIEKNEMVLTSPFLDVFKLPLIEPEGFPELPSMEIKMEVELSASFVRSWFNDFGPFVGNDELRPVMSAINVEIEKKDITIVATNAHILLAKTYNDYLPKEYDSNQFLIPIKSAIVKSITGENVTFSEGDTNIRIEGDVYTIYIRKTEGKYPNWEAVLPKKDEVQAIEIKVNRVKFLEALKAISVLTNETKALQIHVEEKRIRLIAENLDVKKSGNVFVDAEPSFTEDKVGYRYDFLTTVLSTATEEEVTLKGAHNRAGIIYEESDEVYKRILIMPVMITNNG